MQLTIGSSRLNNTDGVISVRGDDQIVFEWGPLRYQLLLTMDLYDFSGYHIARLRRNHWTFNDRDRFVFAADARCVNLIDTRSSQVVLEARVVGEDSVVVTQGAFHSCTGHAIEITVEDWDVVPDSQSVTSPATEFTNPPFASHEILLIREAVVSAQETVECPRCGRPLRWQRLTGATELDSFLVSCSFCRRNLVVRCRS